MFLVDMIWTQTPAHWHLKIPIKWYGSIYFVSLVEKKCSSICPEKATENSIQMVNAQRLWSWSLRISLSCWLFFWPITFPKIFNPSSHMTRRAIKIILQSETTVKSSWHESEDPNGLDQRLSFLGSQNVNTFLAVFWAPHSSYSLSPLRLVFTSDGVVVGVVIRRVERYDLVKIKLKES